MSTQGFKRFRAWRHRRRVERGERAYQMAQEMSLEQHPRDAVTEPLTGGGDAAVSGLSGFNQGGGSG
jgi:hypothetical protein